MVRLARVYDEPRPDDGVRVLVDRLWPRGVSKDDPRVGRWCKQVAPSTELRRWYGHRPERFAQFAERYRAELAVPEAASGLAEVRELITAGPVTLVTATKSVEGSHLTVLDELLRNQRR